jgi:hypothetical protein
VLKLKRDKFNYAPFGGRGGRKRPLREIIRGEKEQNK